MALMFTIPKRHYKSENQNKPGKFYEKSYKKRRVMLEWRI